VKSQQTPLLVSQPTAAVRNQSSSSKKDYPAIALSYAEDILAGRIPACKEVKQACRRHLTDLERAESGKFEYIFDPASGSRVCEFIEALPHPKGKWAAKRELINLGSWQIFIDVSLFGWVERDDPTRYRFRDAYIEVPRKNGKTTGFSAGIELYKFAADGECGAEVYIGATSEDQAKRTGFSAARTMALRSKALCEAFGITVNTKSLTRDDGSVLKPVIARPGDGDSPSCAVCEEYHEHPTSELYDTMKTGMGARENPLALIVTTAGFNRAGPCYAVRQEVQKVLEGTLVNERLFGIIYTIDREDLIENGGDPFSEATLRKANPNFGISIDPKFLLDEARKAKESSRRQNTFLTKHLDVWVNAAVSWMNMAQWDELADPTLKIEDFYGEEGITGVDLANRIDLASKVIVFRRFICDGENGASRDHYYIFCTSYLNAAKVEDSKGEHYQGWEKDGYLVKTPGNVTDYNRIGDDLLEDAQKFFIRQIPHDPHHAAALVQFIQAREDWPQDVEFVEILPTRGNFSPAMKELEAAVLEKRIHHNGDPVLAWAMSNVVALSDARENLFPDKEAPENKIDPAVALIMAMRQWILSDVDGSAPGMDVIEDPAAKKQDHLKEPQPQQ
jgi:phage terminase large subunit-like protein